jgi:hypothetical protein
MQRRRALAWCARNTQSRCGKQKKARNQTSWFRAFLPVMSETPLSRSPDFVSDAMVATTFLQSNHYAKQLDLHAKACLSRGNLK